jgi:beta-N-acetylhexosaminidase
VRAPATMWPPMMAHDGLPAGEDERIAEQVGRAIVSDDLDMHAIAGHMGIDFAAVQAIRAGCDVLLLCCNEQFQAQAEEALIKTAETDSELRRRIGGSAARVRTMKKAHATNQHKRPALGRDIVGSFEHRRLADRLAGRA